MQVIVRFSDTGLGWVREMTRGVGLGFGREIPTSVPDLSLPSAHTHSEHFWLFAMHDTVQDLCLYTPNDDIIRHEEINAKAEPVVIDIARWNSAVTWTVNSLDCLEFYTVAMQRKLLLSNWSSVAQVYSHAHVAPLHDVCCPERCPSIQFTRSQCTVYRALTL